MDNENKYSDILREIIPFLKTDQDKINALNEHSSDLSESDKLELSKLIVDKRQIIQYLEESDLEPNDFFLEELILQLPAELKIECLENSRIYISITIKENIIRSLPFNLQLDCLLDDNLELFSFSKQRIIEDLPIQTKTDIILKDEIKLDQYAKVEIIKSLPEDIIVKILLDANIDLKAISKKEIISKLSEEVKINLLDSNKLVKDKDLIRNIIMSLSSDLVIKYLRDPDIKLDNLSKQAVIEKLSEKDRVLCLKDSNITLSPYSKISIISNLQHKLQLNCLQDQEINLDSFSKSLIIQMLIQDPDKRNFPHLERLLHEFSEAEYMETLPEEERIKSIAKNLDRVTPTALGKIIISLPENKRIRYLNSNIISLPAPAKEILIISLSEDKRIQILEDKKIKLESVSKEIIITSLAEEKRLECLRNNKIKLNSLSKANIISLLSDDVTKLNLLKEFSNELEDADKLLVFFSLDKKDEFYIRDIIKEDKYIYSLGLPSNMTMGYELEVVGEHANTFLRIGELLPGWEIVEEGSIQSGMEVRSPILHDRKEDFTELEKTCQILKKFKFRSSYTTGGHIHFGADYLGSDYSAWEKLFIIYREAEDLIYKMSNEIGEVSRGGVFDFAETVSDDIDSAFADGTISIKNKSDFDRIKRIISHTRHRGLNLANISPGGKNTIEFRMPNGTIDITTLQDNTKFFGSILETAKLMSKDPKYKAEEFSMFKNTDLTEEEKVDAFLNLVFNDENDRSIFKERWESVKDDFIFDEIKPKRMKYKEDIKTEAKEMFLETAVDDRIVFSNELKREINSRDSRDK